jgi:Tetratricopeptide repeat
MRLNSFRILVAAYGLFACLDARSAAAGPMLSESVRQADDYYLGRQDLQNVRKAVDFLRAEVHKNPQDYEAWWRLSKSLCYLGRHTSEQEEIKLLDEGIEAGKRAVTLEPRRAEGHFWLGANYGIEAEERGPLRGLLLLGAIREQMELVAKLDPDYEQAAGLRTLARIDYRAPFFKGGDKRRSIERLEECLKRYPLDSLAMLYLADSLLAVGRRDEAREELQTILSLCPDPQYGPELQENQEDARSKLAGEFHSTT